MTEDEWDAVIAVHLKGHFAPTPARRRVLARAVEGRRRGRARVINTSSPSGVFGNVGQANYGAAKAGIAALTRDRRAGARPLRRHGQLPRAERAHAHDRDDVRGHGGPGGGLRPARPRRTWRRSSSRCARTRRRTSPARSSSSGAARSTCCGRGRPASSSPPTRSWDADELLAQLRERFPEGAAPAGMMAMMQKAGGQSLRAR